MLRRTTTSLVRPTAVSLSRRTGWHLGKAAAAANVPWCGDATIGGPDVPGSAADAPAAPAVLYRPSVAVGETAGVLAAAPSSPLPSLSESRRAALLDRAAIATAPMWEGCNVPSVVVAAIEASAKAKEIFDLSRVHPRLLDTKAVVLAAFRHGRCFTKLSGQAHCDDQPGGSVLKLADVKSVALRADADVAQAAAANGVGGNFKDLPEALQAHKGVVMAFVAADVGGKTAAFANAKRFHGDRDVIAAAVRCHPGALFHAENDVKADAGFVLHLLQSGCAPPLLQYADKSLRLCSDFLWRVVECAPDALAHCDTHLAVDESLAVAAFNRKRELLLEKAGCTPKKQQ